MSPVVTRVSTLSLVAALSLAAAGCGPRADAQVASSPTPFSAPAGVDLDVPYVPTPEPVVQAMLKLGEVDAQDYVIDLGSGDGRIAVGAGRLGARALGVDINPERIAEANANAKAADVTDRVSFRRQNLFETPIAEATVLTMYLLPDVNLKLRPRILSELRPGTRVVSHAFDMGDWMPDATVSAADARVQMWIVPARVDGRWTLTGPGAGTLELEQQFSSVTGSLGGTPIREARLSGDRLQFTADTPQGPRRFSGRVQGDRVAPAPPTPDGNPGAEPVATGWRLTRAR